jgi:hypothetical protein
VKLQLLKVQGLYRFAGRRVLEHNHDLLTLGHSDLPDDVMSTAMDMLKVGVDENQIPDFIHLPTGRQLSGFELAAFDSVELRPALSKNTDDLLEYMEAASSVDLSWPPWTRWTFDPLSARTSMIFWSTWRPKSMRI